MNNFRIKITTLSKVHIGNGESLQNGYDFIFNDSYIEILSLDKLKDIVKLDAQTVKDWTNAILAGEAKKIVNDDLVSGIAPEEYCKRKIKIIGKIGENKWNKSLKECMYDGMGRPYIPGSSIKGAIRTVIHAGLARSKVKERGIINLDKGIKEILDDKFRYLQVGDAYFEKGSEVAVRQINLNIRNSSKDLIDPAKSQIVEAIAENKVSEFRLNIDEKFYDIKVLFGQIREHTKQLIKEDIEFWKKQKESGKSGQDKYINNLNDILAEIEKCKNNETVLRIGQASGWRFVTGAWLEELKHIDDKNSNSLFNQEVIKTKCRPDKYKEYDFPKSRRIAEKDSGLFGFVKLKKIE